MLLYARKNRCGRFEPPVGTGKERKAAIKSITLTYTYTTMGKTSKMQKTPPKKKATQGVEYRRTSPRGHQLSSGEIEVNARKRGTGPVGWGGNMIARLPQSSLSSESSESESELEEEEEGFDGLCGAKRANMSTRDELVEMLREKERTIKKLQAEVHSLRNKSRPNKKDIRERMKWSGEEINFADSVNTFVREFLFPRYKFLRGGWQNYEPDKRNSLSSMCLRRLSLPEGSETEDIWERVIVPTIQMKYVNIKGNMNNDLKKIYISMFVILFENR